MEVQRGKRVKTIMTNTAAAQRCMSEMQNVERCYLRHARRGQHDVAQHTPRVFLLGGQHDLGTKRIKLCSAACKRNDPSSGRAPWDNTSLRTYHPGNSDCNIVLPRTGGLYEQRTTGTKPKRVALVRYLLLIPSHGIPPHAAGPAGPGQAVPANTEQAR